jgi:hypothetical protein
MRNDRHLAIKLRKQKRSYNEISKILGIPKSTLHYWFKKNSWSEKIKKELIKKAQVLARKNLKLMAKANKKKWEEWHHQCQHEAVKEFPAIKDNPLFLAGLMLYWGEGDSKIENSIVRLANIDPEMIRIFSLFLKKICGISKEKIKVSLVLYPDLKEEYCKAFWSKVSDVPLTQFMKSQVIEGRHPTKRLSYGVCTIYHNSRELKEKIFTWIKLYQRELLRV